MSSPATIPEKFGRYTVQGIVGEGAMGRVYRAFDPLAHRVVAIKTIKSEYLTSETRDEYVRRFRREAQAAGALSHPHIITIFDVGEDYFVMELLEGSSLQDILRERGRLEIDETLRILAPVADALDYAHKRGTVHRDIKPANIMVLPDGRPKLMDFGVAHLASTAMTATGQFLGSPSYMAPEQIIKSSASAATDIFSLAVVSYEMITGRKPFEGESITTIIYKVVNEQPRLPRTWNADLPVRYDEIFALALDKDPARRYPTASDFVAALELKEVEGILAPGASEPTLPTLAMETHDLKAEALARKMAEAATAATPPPRRRSAGLVAGLAAVGILVVLLAGGLLLRGGRAPGTSPGSGIVTGLRVETEPAGAVVSVDGKEVGQSPLTLRALTPGNHTVHVTRRGFASAQLSLQMVEGVSLAPLRFVLQPTSASLSLRSEPAAASVQVDGKPAGATPLEAFFLDPGPHELRVERKGFKPWSRRVEGKAGEALDLVARLEPVTRTPTPVKPTPQEPALKEGDLVALTPDVTPPKRLSGEPARYPDAARKLRLDGAVTVDILITETGQPAEVRVVESAGEILDRAVIEAVRTWRFEPARKQGVKVRVHWPYRQRFQIGG